MDDVFTAGRFARPAQRAFTKDGAGAIILLFPDYALARSQIWNRHITMQVSSIGVQQTLGVSVGRFTVTGRPSSGLPTKRAIDIDTPDDWAMAERRFREWNQQRGE